MLTRCPRLVVLHRSSTPVVAMVPVNLVVNMVNMVPVNLVVNMVNMVPGNLVVNMVVVAEVIQAVVDNLGTQTLVVALDSPDTTLVVALDKLDTTLVDLVTHMVVDVA